MLRTRPIVTALCLWAFAPGCECNRAPPPTAAIRDLTVAPSDVTAMVGESFTERATITISPSAEATGDDIQLRVHDENGSVFEAPLERGSARGVTNAEVTGAEVGMSPFEVDTTFHLHSPYADAAAVVEVVVDVSLRCRSAGTADLVFTATGQESMDSDRVAVTCTMGALDAGMPPRDGGGVVLPDGGRDAGGGPPSRTAHVYLAPQSGSVVDALVVTIDDATGEMTSVRMPGAPFPASGESFRLALAGDVLLAGSDLRNDVIAMLVDAATGGLSESASSPLATGQPTLGLGGSGAYVYAATIGAVRQLYAWSVGAGGTMAPIGTPLPITISKDRLAMHPAGSFLAAGGRFGSISIYVIGPDGVPVEAAGSPHDAYTAYGLAFTSLGDRLLTAGPSGVYVFDFDAGTITPVAGAPFSVNTTGGPFPDVMDYVAVHPNGRCVIAVGGSDAVGRTAVYMFTMDAAGALTAIGAPLRVFDQSSIDFALLDDGSHLLALNVFAGAIGAVAIDETTCEASTPSGAPLAAPKDIGGYASMAARLAP